MKVYYVCKALKLSWMLRSRLKSVLGLELGFGLVFSWLSWQFQCSHFSSNFHHASSLMKGEYQNRNQRQEANFHHPKPYQISSANQRCRVTEFVLNNGRGSSKKAKIVRICHATGRLFDFIWHKVEKYTVALTEIFCLAINFFYNFL